MSTVIIEPTHQMEKIQLTREEVLDFLNKSWGSEESWASDNDAYNLKERGECYAMIMAGCAYQAYDAGDEIVIRISYRGFEYFWEDQKVFSTAMYSIPKGV